MAESKSRKVAVLGSGLIGMSYSMLFASAGYRVSMYDVVPDQVTKAQATMRQQLKDLEAQGLMRGSLTAEQQCALVSPAQDLKSCVEGAFFVQECVHERIEAKRSLWVQVDELVSDDVIMSSSASALLPSAISLGLKHKHRFIVSHPTNPPFYAPLVELVPAEWTQEDVIRDTWSLLSSLGLEPVLVKKEIAGFVLNRLQYAILGEAWKLVRDGVMSAGDVDKVMSCGLGTRYAFMGPWETAYLNANGMESYVDRYADMIVDIQKSQLQEPEKMARGATLDAISKDMEEVAGPVSSLDTRRQWRDRRLAGLTKLKADMAATDKKIAQNPE